MNYSKATRDYREAAVWGASPVELVITMYDLLIEDLSTACGALRTGDIPSRTNATKHAFAVLEQLQSNISSSGGDAADCMDRLYSIARAKILEGVMKQRATTLEEVKDLFIDLRKAWKQADGGSRMDESRTTSTGPNPETSSEIGLPRPATSSTTLAGCDWSA